MKVCTLQPYYSTDYSDADKCFAGLVSLLDECDDSMDVIVMPEYSDIPTVCKKEDLKECFDKFNKVILDKAKATAIRCNAIVFCNASYENKNTTHVIDRKGNVVGRYFKAHPAPREGRNGNGFDDVYSYVYSEPYTVDIEGVRYGFMTCYDFYMYEAFASLARKNVDIIIGCSHQRTDTHQALEIIGKFLCYNTNSYLVRSSVTLGEESPICGCSMICAPDGTMIENMHSRIGMATAEIDPKNKYYKPAGFNGKPKSHYEYIDEGRRPFLYRPGGPMMIASDEFLPYPRVCAHRGFNTIAPENSLPAYGAAVALGAEEIEFDLWATKDGELISCHDWDLDRVSTGKGKVYDYTFEQIKQFDFGVKRGEHFTGLAPIKFEDILKKFSCTTIMNIHVKLWDVEGFEPMYDKIGSLVEQYDCCAHVYFMSGDREDKHFAEFKKRFPWARLCMGAGPAPWKIVDRAIEKGAQKVQLFKPYFNQEMIDKAHAHNIKCNVFFSDDPKETIEYLNMGIDTILSNDYLTIANTVNEWKKQHK